MTWVYGVVYICPVGACLRWPHGAVGWRCLVGLVHARARGWRQDDIAIGLLRGHISVPIVV
jgi:hypothetical protein